MMLIHKAICVLSLGFALWYIEGRELEAHALEMLRVLHPVDEVPADDLGYIGIGKVRTDDVARGLLLAEDLLVAFRAAYVLPAIVRYEVCRKR